MNECTFCHGPEGTPSLPKIHREHVSGQWQWCYNCHDGMDGKPLGLQPPVTEPAESCQLCHDDKSFVDEHPFGVHKKHAKRNKCYACHQATPPLFDWPGLWLGGTPLLTVANLTAGSTSTLTVENVGPGHLVLIAFSLTGGGPTASSVGPLLLTSPIFYFPPLPADPSGELALSAFVPTGTGGTPLWVQALDVEAIVLTNGLAEVIQ